MKLKTLLLLTVVTALGVILLSSVQPNTIPEWLKSVATAIASVGGMVWAQFAFRPSSAEDDRQQRLQRLIARYQRQHPGRDESWYVCKAIVAVEGDAAPAICYHLSRGYVLPETQMRLYESAQANWETMHDRLKALRQQHPHWSEQTVWEQVIHDLRHSEI